MTSHLAGLNRRTAIASMAKRATWRKEEDFQMQYMLAFFEPQGEFDKRNDPAQADDYWGSWMAYIGALRNSGLVVSGNGLELPQSASLVRLRDGKREVHDGPFIDTKEMLGGYFIIEADSLDLAIEWAARSPAASAGTVEVRPVMPPPANG